MLQKLDRYFGLFTVIIILIGYFFIYDQHIAVDPILQRDDRALLDPMLLVDSLDKYIELHKTNDVKDAQPVRDITFLFNVYLRNKFNLSLFHFTNMCFTLMLLFVFFRFLKLIGFSKNLALISTLILAFHPILVSSIGWISARKHILSILFIMMAIYDIFKNKDVTKKSILYYFLSIFSHPITILLPAWVFILRLTGNVKKLSFNFFFLCTTCLFGFYINYIKFLFLGYGNTAKIGARSLFSTLSTATLSFGRSISIIFTPKNFSAVYYEGHLDNLIGLGILGLVILIYKRFAPLKQVIIWTFLFVFVNATYVQYFMNETYLYLPLITQIIIITYIIKDQNLIAKLYGKLSLIAVIVVFILQSNNVAKMWLNDNILWRISFLNERSPRTKFCHGADLFEIDPKLSFEFVTNAAPDFQFKENYAITVTYLYIIHKAAGVPLNRKLEEFEKVKDRLGNLAIWNVMYNLTLLMGTDEEMDTAYKNIEELAKNRSIKDFEIQQIFNIELRNYCKETHPKHAKVCPNIKESLVLMEEQEKYLKTKAPNFKRGKLFQLH